MGRGLNIVTQEDIDRHIKLNNITIEDVSPWRRKRGNRFTPKKKKRKK